MKTRDAAFLLAMVPGLSAAAQPFTIESSTIDSGGGTLVGGTYELSGTIGQPDAGETLVGSTYELRGGFWVSGSTPGELCADQNADGVVNPSDFAAWIANYNTSNPRADTNQNGAVEPSDFSAWVSAYNLGAAGPLCNF